LTRGGLIDPDQWLLPGSAMRLDRFGNIAGPQMVQLLSRVKAFGEAGYAMNVTAKSAKRAKRLRTVKGKSGTTVFIGRTAHDHRARALFLKLGGREVAPLLVFVSRRPHYQARFHFQQLAVGFARKRFPAEMMRALKESIERA